MASGRGGTERVLAKLKRSVEAGNYYEAHQMYRTLYFRYSTKKKFTDALDILYSGAIMLLRHKQLESGSDLALLFVEVLNKSSSELSDDILVKLGALHRMIGHDIPERLTYIQAALKWSGEVSELKSRAGHPKLHQKFAWTFWREKNYAQSRYHFLHSSDGEGCAAMLIEYQVTSGFQSEVDLFIAQAVLQYLCLKNLVCANVCFHYYTAEHPQVESGPPFIRPLLNFLWLLLLAVDGGSTVAVFTILVEQYQPSLKRDPSYNEYLDRIGQLFFGIPPPEPSQNRFLGNLLQSLLGGDNLEDEGSTGQSSSQGPASSFQAMEMDQPDLD
ncbi:Golgi to ER traffic protein 4-like [Lamellibrachia satsuma]|nr:Golgi to ER traffic protein 4-like [Lamellibrachia satsuma]